MCYGRTTRAVRTEVDSRYSLARKCRGLRSIKQRLDCFKLPNRAVSHDVDRSRGRRISRKRSDRVGSCSHQMASTTPNRTVSSGARLAEKAPRIERRPITVHFRNITRQLAIPYNSDDKPPKNQSCRSHTRCGLYELGTPNYTNSIFGLESGASYINNIDSRRWWTSITTAKKKKPSLEQFLGTRLSIMVDSYCFVPLINGRCVTIQFRSRREIYHPVTTNHV